MPSYEVLISVQDQKLAVLKDGSLLARYPVSTSRFGTGDGFGSYKTPLGEMRISEKIGENLSPGAVIHHRSPTGEVLAVNAPGRDTIVTRVISLDGLEAQNKNAHQRGIYIHGTPEERTLGKPVSWGCVRMRSIDVIKVFDEVPVGTVVAIIPDKLPRMRRYEAPKAQPPDAAPDANSSPSPEPAASPAEKPANPEAAPSSAPPKPESSPVDKQPAEGIAHESTAKPLPPIAEAPEHSGGISALRWLKSSILLANLPGSDKSSEHKTDKTQ